MHLLGRVPQQFKSAMALYLQGPAGSGQFGHIPSFHAGCMRIQPISILLLFDTFVEPGAPLRDFRPVTPFNKPLALSPIPKILDPRMRNGRMRVHVHVAQYRMARGQDAILPAAAEHAHMQVRLCRPLRVLSE